MKRKWQIFFYSWFGLVSIFCVLLDLFMSTIQPDNHAKGQGWFTSYFDLSIINQFIYISVWTTLLVATFGILSFIALFVKKMPKWILGKNNRTFLVSMTSIVFFVYTVSLISNPDGIIGFDIWYKILKSSLEHFITPILMVVFYFCYVDKEQNVSCKAYAKKYGWLTIIFTGTYILVMVIRAAMLYNYGPKSDYLNQRPENAPSDWNWEDNSIAPFPYVVSPWTSPWYIWIPAGIAIVLSPYGVGNLYNWWSNHTNDWYFHHVQKKHDLERKLA
ncbi:hypothetical protein [Mesoplasma lactucae]|uniref:Uncharacterized protein n=1 Tax=Mesoplasma lactucae ATCC 49193 TaxID=81460 RepID=A0A291IRT3_9MOLU|nr:hypothetical protein [Mesoplasma lactucae]ATG97509.1 hypothetical protein CP520_01945 [Mesoplasma lactucae ATCC 49193]ATZ20035.1 hypothetical protein MLACT_v1c02130 [Mesoplasma lactucae ATCC 49193]MCL8217014.1 hypothetical protein [Mesoplasma lactucae ATCC 49193]